MSDNQLMMPIHSVGDLPILGVTDEGLGNTSWVLRLGDDAVVVDPGALADRVRDVGDGPLVTMCGHGERAATAASILESAGHRDVAILDGGPDDWTTAIDQPLEQS